MKHIVNFIFFLLFVLFFSLGCKHHKNTPAEKIFTLRQVNNFNEIENIFHKQTDTTYLINFWATTCPPCLKEIPFFEKLLKEKNGEKFQIILINTDLVKHIESRVIPYLKENMLNSRVLMLTDPDARIWTGKVHPDWFGALPFSVIYKKEKREFHFEPFESYEDLRSAVEKILNNQ